MIEFKIERGMGTGTVRIFIEGTMPDGERVHHRAEISALDINNPFELDSLVSKALTRCTNELLIGMAKAHKPDRKYNDPYVRIPPPPLPAGAKSWDYAIGNSNSTKPIKGDPLVVRI